TYNSRGNLRVDHVDRIDAGDVWNSEGHRISRLAWDGFGCGKPPRLGTVGSVLSSIGLITCHGLGRACRLLYRVRRRDSRLPVLRSSPQENIRLGNLSFSWRDRSWNRRHWRTDFTALARSSFRSVHACILDSGGGG